MNDFIPFKLYNIPIMPPWRPARLSSSVTCNYEWLDACGRRVLSDDEAYTANILQYRKGFPGPQGFELTMGLSAPFHLTSAFWQ